MAGNEFSGSVATRRRPLERSNRSGARAAAFWGVAIVAGVGAALLITRHLEQRSAATAVASTKVVVAAIDLPLATRLRAEQLTLVDWPASATPPGAIHDLKEATDRILTVHALAGEPVLTGRLAAKGSGNGLAALIPGNMRAIAVHVDDVVGVAGFIHPDDRVDVIATLRPTHPHDAEPVSKVILQNVKVLAVGKELEVSEGNRAQATPTTVATLLVEPDGSEKLALAANEGRIMLTLRSWTDTDQIATGGIKPSVLLGDGAPAPPAAVVPPAPAHHASRREGPAPSHPTPSPAVAQSSPRKEIVEILRGDRFEERKFDAKDKEKTEELKP